ncbi:MAG: phenylalanine--tRNA ligase subunit beta [Candidatus Bipolaricaulota bacterium]
MKIPYKWLQDYVDIEFGQEIVNEISERLTIAGAEVESVEYLPPPSRLVVGKVLDTQPHPNADNLLECTVNTGNRNLQLISGAPNIVTGALVPVIPEGGKLPGGQSINTAKIQGRRSAGMLCSKEELGLAEKSEGIWLLPDDNFAPGDNLTEILEYDDYIMQFEITSNRPDLLSVLGIAREISAIFGIELQKPQLDYSGQGDSGVEIEIKNPQDTNRYSCSKLTLEEIKPSPPLIQHRLWKSGLRFKNNVVDATNYVLLELGHPLHPFDGKAISGNTIEIRRARRGEQLTTIDGERCQLDGQNLVIADSERAIALAGIMGGQNTEVTKRTREVLLESARFDPIAIRESSKQLGTSTEASRRFERGADPEMTLPALARVFHLLDSQGALTSFSKPEDNYPTPATPPTIDFEPERVPQVAGLDLPTEDIRQILNSLECTIANHDGEKLQVKPPTFRGDLAREIDLVEEITRIHGYDAIPAEEPQAGTVDLSDDPETELVERVRETLIGLGFYEAINPGFEVEAELEFDREPLRMLNPMGEKRSELRTNLTEGLVELARDHFHKGVSSIRLFEIGKVFEKKRNSDPQEELSLGCLLTGRKYLPGDGKESYDLWDLKGVLEDFLDELGVKDYQFPSGGPDFLHPTRRSDLKIDGQNLGYLGELHPGYLDEMDLPHRVHLCEIRLEDLAQFRKEQSFSPLPKYPASTRDLSLTVPQDIEETRVREVLLSDEHVDDLHLYDIYRGEQVGPEKLSLTYELTFRDPHQTLEDQEIDTIIEKLRSELKQLGISLRK